MATKSELKAKCDQLGAGIVEMGALIDGLPADAGPFTDNFNRANQNLEANGSWTRVGGSAGWGQISSNVLKTTNTDGLGVAYQTPELGSASQFVSAVFLSNLSLSFLCVRLVDAGNWIGMRWYNGNLEIFKRTGGAAFSTIATFATPRDTAVFRLEYNAAAGTVRALKNGAQVIAPKSVGSLTGLAASTRAGVVLRGVELPFIDDFSSGPLA